MSGIACACEPNKYHGAIRVYRGERYVMAEGDLPPVEFDDGAVRERSIQAFGVAPPPKCVACGRRRAQAVGARSGGRPA